MFNRSAFANIRYGKKSYKFGKALRTSYTRNAAIGEGVVRGFRHTTAWLASRLWD